VTRPRGADCQAIAGASSSSLYYIGRCNKTCDRQCNATARPADDTKFSITACCEGGIQVPSLCYASCLMGWNYSDAIAKCYPGQCRASRAIQMFQQSASHMTSGGLHADCAYLMNRSPSPCETTKCKPKGFSCVTSNYASFYRFDYNMDLCLPLWINNTDGNLFHSCPSQ
jgi:hypothetical protein